MSFLHTFGIDLKKDFADKPDLERYLEWALEVVEKDYQDPFDSPEAPVLKTDFSNYLVIAGLPKISSDK